MLERQFGADGQVVYKDNEPTAGGPEPIAHPQSNGSPAATRFGCFSIVVVFSKMNGMTLIHPVDEPG
jgi:hypothetical protein